MSPSLSPSSDQLLAVVYDGPIGLAVVAAEGDDRGRLMRANPALCELLGYTEGELLEMTFHSISHPDDAGDGREAFDRLLAGDVHSLDVERRVMTAAGEVRWVRLYVSRPHDAPRRVVVQVSDISEQKRLVTGQAAMIDAAIDAIVGIDAAGLLTEFNPAAERVFGYSGASVTTPDALERAAGFLQKPFNAEELLDCVGEALFAGARPPV